MPFHRLQVGKTRHVEGQYFAKVIYLEHGGAGMSSKVSLTPDPMLFPPLYPKFLYCLNSQPEINNPSKIIWTNWNIRLCIFFQIILIIIFSQLIFLQRQFAPMAYPFPMKTAPVLWIFQGNLPHLWLPLMPQDRSPGRLQLRRLFDHSFSWVPEASNVLDNRLFLFCFHQCWNANDSFFPEKLPR